MRYINFPIGLAALLFCTALLLPGTSYSATETTDQAIDSDEVKTDIEPEKDTVALKGDQPDTPEAETTPAPVIGVKPEQKKPSLSERVQTFIPSEEIDTEKAVAFPTNI